MRGGWVVVAVGLVVAASGCSLFRRTAPHPAVVGATEEGIASWYGPGFHGNRTANGEVYDQYDLTAAHPSLPLGTRVMVTNLVNGRSVEVRINDRGPYVDGRIVDLSYAAARSIDMIGPGTSRVRLEILGPATTTVARRPAVPAAAVPAAAVQTAAVQAAAVPRTRTAAARSDAPVEPQPRTAFVVQVASFGDPRTADHLARVLSHRFPDAFVDMLETVDGRYHRVRIGPYAERATATARAELVSRLGWPAIIMEAPR